MEYNDMIAALSERERIDLAARLTQAAMRCIRIEAKSVDDIPRLARESGIYTVKVFADMLRHLENPQNPAFFDGVE